MLLNNGNVHFNIKLRLYFFTKYVTAPQVTLPPWEKLKFPTIQIELSNIAY